jgi:hypothetical protein
MPGLEEHSPDLPAAHIRGAGEVYSIFNIGDKK